MAGDPEREKLDEFAARLRAAETIPKPAARETPAGGNMVGMGRLGFDFGATVFVCILMGWLADRQFGTRPWGLLLMTLLGFFAGMRHVWRGLAQREQTTGQTGPHER